MQDEMIQGYLRPNMSMNQVKKIIEPPALIIPYTPVQRVTSERPMEVKMVGE